MVWTQRQLLELLATISGCLTKSSIAGVELSGCLGVSRAQPRHGSMSRGFFLSSAGLCAGKYLLTACKTMIHVKDELQRLCEAMPGYLLALPGMIDPTCVAALCEDSVDFKLFASCGEPGRFVGTFLTSSSAQAMNQMIEARGKRSFPTL